MKRECQFKLLGTEKKKMIVLLKQPVFKKGNQAACSPLREQRVS